uniref:LolCTLc n=1 Tax=Bichromomyia olmeca TaxID=715919 RepID=A0A1B1V3F6_9DIPT|nr:LolCTLc [Bichromomyia olmeca]
MIIRFCVAFLATYLVLCEAYTVSKEKKSWKDALKDCHRHRKTLVTIHSELEYKKLAEKFPNEVKPADVPVWINGHNGQHGHSNKHGNHTSYTNWAGGEPKMDLAKSCVQIKDGGKWYTADCNTPNYYACTKRRRRSRKHKKH